MATKISELNKEELTAALEGALSDLTDFLGLQMEYDYSILEYEGPEGDARELLNVQLRGDKDSLLIGYHGQTLDKLQHLVSLALSKHFQQVVRVLLDINDYRKNRIDYLKGLATRAAQQVIESGQEMELEPMRPADRRVIHQTLNEENQVRSESVGEGNERRIVIKPLSNV